MTTPQQTKGERTKSILDHNEPSRLACDSEPQRTWMAKMHAASHASDMPPAIQADMDASLRRAIDYGRMFDGVSSQLGGSG